MNANDIVQETFTKVWVKHEEISFEKVKSYLFTTAYHAIVDWAKKDKRSGDIEYAPEQEGTSGDHHDLKEVLEEALNKLPEIQKSVVLLRDYEGYSYEEIAEITGITESTSKTQYMRAKSKLLGILKEMNEHG